MSGLKKRFLQRMGNRDKAKCATAAAAAAGGGAESGSDSPSTSQTSSPVKAKSRDGKKRSRKDRASSLEEALMSPWRLVFSTGVDSSGSGGEDGASLDSLCLNDSPVFVKRATAVPLSPLLGRQDSLEGAVGGCDPFTEEVRIDNPSGRQCEQSAVKTMKRRF